MIYYKHISYEHSRSVFLYLNEATGVIQLTFALNRTNSIHLLSAITNKPFMLPKEQTYIKHSRVSRSFSIHLCKIAPATASDNSPLADKYFNHPHHNRWAPHIPHTLPPSMLVEHDHLLGGHHLSHNVVAAAAAHSVLALVLSCPVLLLISLRFSRGTKKKHNPAFDVHYWVDFPLARDDYCSALAPFPFRAPRFAWRSAECGV